MHMIIRLLVSQLFLEKLCLYKNVVKTLVMPCVLYENISYFKIVFRSSRNNFKNLETSRIIKCMSRKINKIIIIFYINIV